MFVSSWRSLFLLLLLHAGLHGLAAKQCQHQGQCLGGVLLKEYLTDSLESCITQGGQVEGAKFVTWKNHFKLCQAFSFCQSVDVEAEAVTSSLVCNLVRGRLGECVGQIYAVTGEVDCKQLCEETPTCARSTYLEEQQYCLIFADCTSLATNCTKCYTSKKSCLEDTAAAPSTINPNTNPSTAAVPSPSTATAPPTPYHPPPPSPPSPPSSPTAMNKILYIDDETGKTTLVSLVGDIANCDLEDYPANSNFPAAVTYNNGEVMACGTHELEDADRCWRFNGSSWSPMPNSNQAHCRADTSNIMVNGSWWVIGKLQSGYDYCSDTTTSEVFTEHNTWIPGPTFPGDEYPALPCLVNLNTTHTMMIGGYPARRDAWIYNWRTQEWTRTGSLIQGRRHHGCLSLDDKGVLVVGGGYGRNVYTVELYNPAQGTWSSHPNLPRYIDPIAPILFNWDDEVLALFRGKDRIYKQSKEDGKWRQFNVGRLPKLFGGLPLDKAVLVPDTWSCFPA